MMDASNGRKALILSGGGARAAYQAGAATALIRDSGINFSIFCGAGIGCLNSVMLAQGDLHLLRQMWLNIRNSDDVYLQKPRFRALMSNTPLRQKARAQIDASAIRKAGNSLIIPVVNLNTGNVEIANQDTPDLWRWVMAATILPLAFSPMRIRSNDYVTGMIRNVSPIKLALDAGAEDIWVVLATPLHIKLRVRPFNNIIDIGLRTLEILHNDMFMRDIENVRSVNRRLESGQLQEGLRYVGIHVLAPQKMLCNAMDFRTRKIAKVMDIGYHDANRMASKQDELPI